MTSTLIKQVFWPCSDKPSSHFRGELVTQDPNDEPAAVLLERIQAEQQAQPKRKAIKSKQSHR